MPTLLPVTRQRPQTVAEILATTATLIPAGAFDLAAPIGRGGMGVVWLGVHRKSQRPVAVKVLASERARSPTFHSAFLREVQAVAGMDHPHIVDVYDYGRISAKAAPKRSASRSPSSRST